MNWTQTWLSIGCLTGCLLGPGPVAPARAAEPLCGVSATGLLSRATLAEGAGRAADAIAAYEELLRRDRSCEGVIAPRLVLLYADGGQAVQALSWAVRVARRMPVPNAYLAAVHARLGQWRESELLLRQALREEPEPRGRLSLLWQLADVQERLGDAEGALATLAGAREAAPDEESRRTSMQRRDALQRRLPAAQMQSATGRGGRKAEDTP